jgi:hypothetical protein
MGDLSRPALVVGQTAFAMRQHILNVWKPGNVTEVDVAPDGSTSYKLRGAIHQLSRIILKLRILVLLPVSTLPYVVNVKHYS